LFLSQSFSNGALVPLGGHGTVLSGPRAEAELRQRPKLGIFIDEQGATSVESLLKGATAHKCLRTTVLSDTDKSCKLIQQSVGEQPGNSPRNIQNMLSC